MRIARLSRRIARGLTARRYRGLLGALALATIALGGCAPRSADFGELVWDPQVAVLDELAPHYHWREQHGSLLLGSGWSPTRGRRTSRGDRLVAAVLGREAVVWVERPPGGRFDFYAYLRAFQVPGAPAQSLELQIGGRRVGPVPLGKDWELVRLPLPAGALAPGLNELRLRFAWAKRHSEMTGSSDEQEYSAFVSELGIVPHEVVGPRTFLHAGRLDPAAREVTLPVAGGLTMPLPPRASVAARLEAVRFDCDDCELVVEWQDPSGSVEWLAEQAPSAPARPGLDVRIETPEAGWSRLRLRLVGGGRIGGRHPRTVTFRLPQRWLSIRIHDGSAGPPPIFLYVVDTLRADALSLYGSPRDTSPQLARLAADGVVYRDAWTASSWTLPATVSVLTGVLPKRHRVMRGDIKFSAESVPGLAQLLAERGYRTAGISQSFVAGPSFGVDTGFERFFLDNQLNTFELASARVRRYLVQWLLSLGAEAAPVFVYLHTVDPHAPYEPPEPWDDLAEAMPGQLASDLYVPHRFMAGGYGEDPAEVAHLRARYDGEVQHADAELGRFLELLKLLGLYERSLVAFLSDHGEEFGEHAGFDHGRTVWEEMLRVPLVVKYPRQRGAGSEVTQRVSTMDLAATVLEVAGGAPAALRLDGRSLPRGGRWLDRGEPRPVYTEVRPEPTKELAAVDWRAVALGPLKCVESRNGVDQFGRSAPPLAAYDLSADPAERTPLPDTDPRLARCRDLIASWEYVGHGEGGSTAATDAETAARLRALGYIE